MKKIIALILALAMILSLAACGGGNDSADDAQDTNVETQAAGDETTAPDETDAPEETEAAAIAAGDRGVGPFTLTNDLFDMTIPEGFGYSVDSWFEGGDYNTFEIGLALAGSSSYNRASVTVTSQRMNVSDLDGCAAEAIRMNTFSGAWDSEIGDDVTIGDYVYRLVTVSKADTDSKSVYVTNFVDINGKDVYVEIVTTDVGPFGTLTIEQIAPVVESIILHAAQ